MAGLHDIYISHAPPDRETAEMLGFFLRGEGLCCATSACGAPAAAGSARLLVLVFSGHAGACVSVQEEVALAAANKLFELAGTRSTLGTHNLDRFWRDARTHTLHDPVRWKYHLLGAYTLNGTLPARHQWN